MHVAQDSTSFDRHVKLIGQHIQGPFRWKNLIIPVSGVSTAQDIRQTQERCLCQMCVGTSDAHQIKLGDLACRQRLPMEATKVSISLGPHGKTEYIVIVAPARLFHHPNQVKDVEADRANLSQEFVFVLFLLY
jgi:hypothetical protein